MTGCHPPRGAATGTLKTFGYGFAWSSVQPLRVIAVMSDAYKAPELLQISAPKLSAAKARIYNFVQEESVEISCTEGNASRFEGNHCGGKIGATWKPDWGKGLSFTADYVHIRPRNAWPILAVPSALPAALPNHFMRASVGSLTRFNPRPVKVTHSSARNCA